jgi:hypothetical protein
MLIKIKRIGGETLGVAQKTYAVKWFNKNEVNLVFGFIASVSLLVSFLENVDPKIQT